MFENVFFESKRQIDSSIHLFLSLDHFSSFNRKEQDFETLDGYNDYLEMVETYSKS